MMLSKRAFKVALAMAKGKKFNSNTKAYGEIAANGFISKERSWDLNAAGLAAVGMKLVDCDGEAHSNPYIDNCSLCAPRWGKVAIPVEFSSLEAYEAYRDPKTLLRTLKGPAQGRYMRIEKADAEEDLKSFIENNTVERIESIYGAGTADTFRVDAFECWDSGDPKGIYVDD